MSMCLLNVRKYQLIYNYAQAICIHVRVRR